MGLDETRSSDLVTPLSLYKVERNRAMAQVIKGVRKRRTGCGDWVSDGGEAAASMSFVVC